MTGDSFPFDLAGAFFMGVRQTTSESELKASLSISMTSRWDDVAVALDEDGAAEENGFGGEVDGVGRALTTECFLGGGGKDVDVEAEYFVR